MRGCADFVVAVRPRASRTAMRICNKMKDVA